MRSPQCHVHSINDYKSVELLPSDAGSWSGRHDLPRGRGQSPEAIQGRRQCGRDQGCDLLLLGEPEFNSAAQSGSYGLNWVDTMASPWARRPCIAGTPDHGQADRDAGAVTPGPNATINCSEMRDAANAQTSTREIRLRLPGAVLDALVRWTWPGVDWPRACGSVLKICSALRLLRSSRSSAGSKRR
jgi:hypothetical protein